MQRFHALGLVPLLFVAAWVFRFEDAPQVEVQFVEAVASSPVVIKLGGHDLPAPVSLVPEALVLAPDDVLVPEPTPEPIPEPTPEPVVMAAAEPPRPLPPPAVYTQQTVLTPEELDAAARAAGWPEDLWSDMRRIIMECENPSLDPNAANMADPHGGSHGLAQLNIGWFTRWDDVLAERYDPVVNLRVALQLRMALGRFGGGGGWSCASRLNIP